MSDPIGLREFNEAAYRKFIRTLSDEELIKAGKRLRILCGDVVTPNPSTFDRQLTICREEYRRRRHPKWFTRATYASAHFLTVDSTGVEQKNVRLFHRNLENLMSMKDALLKYPNWQEPYRAAVTEANPKLLKHKISDAQQAALLRFKELENNSDHHAELRALTDALTALKILGETIWAE